MNIILCFLVLTSLVYGNDRIVAWVNDEIITQQELEYALEPHLKKEDVLNTMINQILLTNEAKRNLINVSPSSVEERFSEIKTSFPSDKMFNDALKNKGLDKSMLKKRIYNEILRMKLINSLKEKIMISEEELLSQLEKYKEEVSVSFFEFEEEETANKVFLELTKKGTTSWNMKDLSFFCYPEMKEKFSKVAFGLDKGKISHPFLMDGKFYIIIMKERKETSLDNLAKIRDELFIEIRGTKRPKSHSLTRKEILSEILELLEERMKNNIFEERLSSFLNELRKKAYIRIVAKSKEDG